MRLLDLIRREKVAVTVAGDVLVVTMAGTDFSITYEKTNENRLVACSFQARKFQDERRRGSFPKFLGLAWTPLTIKPERLAGWFSGRQTDFCLWHAACGLCWLARCATLPMTVDVGPGDV